MNKEDTNRHVKVDGKEPREPQIYTKNYRQLRILRAKEISLPPREKAHQFVILYQMISPENIHAGKIRQTEQPIIGSCYVCTYK